MNTYLLTWDPKNFAWGDIDKSLGEVERAGAAVVRWSCGNTRSIEPGDRVFLLRQGKDKRGIVASGYALSAPYEGPHWSGKSGKQAHYVEVQLGSLVDPRREDPLDINKSRDRQLDKVHWATQSSGISIPERAADVLAGRWRAHLAFLGHKEECAYQDLNRGKGSRLAPMPRHWWANHKQTYRQERDGGYLWSPKKNANGANNESYNNMTRARVGDYVWSFASGHIGALGVLLGVCIEARKPTEFGATGKQWGEDPGWRVLVRFVDLAKPLDIQAHASDLAATLPVTHSPIRANGHGNQGVYLAAVPDAMVAALKGLMGDQWDTVQSQLEDLGSGESLSELVEEVRLEQRTDIGPTEKKTLVSARRGQGIYRTNLELIEKSCRLTGVFDRRHLRASHIKPWRVSDDREKLDGYNGLLLSPHVDHLFDQGHISFDDDGTLLISNKLNRAVLERWGLKESVNVGMFRPQQCAYLKYHRDEVFGKRR